MGLDLTRYLDSSPRGTGVPRATTGLPPAQSTRRWYGFLSVVRPRRVVLSEHAHALEALRQLHRDVGAPFAASLLDKPSGAPAHLSAVHRSELVAGPCRVRRDLRHF